MRRFAWQKNVQRWKPSVPNEGVRSSSASAKCSVNRVGSGGWWGGEWREGLPLAPLERTRTSRSGTAALAVSSPGSPPCLKRLRGWTKLVTNGEQREKSRAGGKATYRSRPPWRPPSPSRRGCRPGRCRSAAAGRPRRLASPWLWWTCCWATWRGRPCSTWSRAPAWAEERDGDFYRWRREEAGSVGGERTRRHWGTTEESQLLHLRLVLVSELVSTALSHRRRSLKTLWSWIQKSLEEISKFDKPLLMKHHD